MARPKGSKTGAVKGLDGFEQKWGNVLINPEDVELVAGFWSTGSPKVDALLGGGLPMGALSEFYGVPQCISGDATVMYQVRNRHGKVLNSKGGPIARLYERFKQIQTTGPGVHLRSADTQLLYYAPCVDADGRIFMNRIRDVIYSGVKPCLRIEAEGGYVVEATADHKFWTDRGWQRLGQLGVGDTVFLHNNTRQRTTEEDKAKQRKRNTTERAELYVKFHPVAGTKVVEGKYLYKRLRRSRAVVEALWNNLTLEEYLYRLNNGYLEGLRFLSRDEHVHHADEDITNDSPDNLHVVNNLEHKRIHAFKRQRDLRYIESPAKVISISEVGERETYDLVMQAPHHNFVANGFVVHNSGKSTLALSTSRQVIAAGGRVLYIDLERGYDIRNARTREWLEKNGIDPTDSHFRIARPYTGEDMYRMIVDSVQSCVHQFIVIDSMAAVATEAELEGDIGDAHMGQVSRLNSQALKVLFRKFGHNHETHIAILNQVRDVIGGMSFGPRTKSTGGRALEHWVGMKIKLIKMGREAGIGDEVLTKVKVQAEKSRYGAAQSVDIKISSVRGVDTLQDIMDFAIDRGFICRDPKSAQYHLYSQPIESFAKIAKDDRESHANFVAKITGEDAMKEYLHAFGWYDKFYGMAVSAVQDSGIETEDLD
jgi:RecA/RadA recombinase